MQIKSTSLSQIVLLPEIERSAGKAFLSIPELAFVASGEVMSLSEHQRFVELGTSWVACVDDQCLGFVCAERFGSDLHVWELAVHADAQRQGIGSALMRCVLADAAGGGAEFVTLTTFREVVFNAPFYARMGFQLVVDAAVAPTKSAAQDARLRDVLEAEAAHGLPAESRCAMRFVVSPRRLHE